MDNRTDAVQRTKVKIRACVVFIPVIVIRAEKGVPAQVQKNKWQLDKEKNDLRDQRSKGESQARVSIRMVYRLISELRLVKK